MKINEKTRRTEIGNKIANIYRSTDLFMPLVVCNMYTKMNKKNGVQREIEQRMRGKEKE